MPIMVLPSSNNAFRNRRSHASTSSGSAVENPRWSTLMWLCLIVLLASMQILFFSSRCPVEFSTWAEQMEAAVIAGIPGPSRASKGAAPGRNKKKPAFHIDPIFRKEQIRIDSISPEERCAAFGVQPHKDGSPRRVFFGSMLADENMEVAKIHAIEAHDIYEVVALVESNTTHFATPRTLRYRNTPDADFLQYSGMFGNHTRVVFDYWLEDMPSLQLMDREVEQRNIIVNIWKAAGMTERDIGLMADFDEVVSRDFLRAVQQCDFPVLRVEPSPSCQAPKLVLSTIQYEASPMCVNKKAWFHPDMVLGQCIDGIGDPSERVVPLRSHLRRYGQRVPEYGAHDHSNFPKHVLESNRFPLWSGRDIRGVQGSIEGMVNYKETPGQEVSAAFGTGFHFHNWFNDLEATRRKYATYGHASRHALTSTLSGVVMELDLTVRCVRNLGNDVNKYKGQGGDYYEHGDSLDAFWENFKGNRPIYFLNESYVRERHALVQNLVAGDEAKYGSPYKN